MACSSVRRASQDSSAPVCSESVLGVGVNAEARAGLQAGLVWISVVGAESGGGLLVWFFDFQAGYVRR